MSFLTKSNIVNCSSTTVNTNRKVYSNLKCINVLNYKDLSTISLRFCAFNNVQDHEEESEINLFKDNSILGLAWCPAKLIIGPRNKRRASGNKQKPNYRNERPDDNTLRGRPIRLVRTPAANYSLFLTITSLNYRRELVNF